MKNKAKEIIKAIPLGGHAEIGKNCWVLEYQDEILILNFGMMLPGMDISGVDLIFPNINYLLENQQKIKGLILTSAHDDFSGGVNYLLSKIKIPKIVGSELAIECIKSQLKDKSKLPEIDFLESRKKFAIGNFNITSITNTSVLPDTYGLFIESPGGNILYTGSYKVDQTPPDSVPFDYYMYSKAGEDGVDLLISDSSNLESAGYSPSERSITKRFDEIFKNSTGRVIIVGYASSLHKYSIFFKLAEKNKRKVCICSEYLQSKINAAISTGHIKVNEKLFVDKNQIENLKDEEIVFIASGKYGDFLSSLMNIANANHPVIKVKPTDIVVVSANPPPGTARILAHTIDQFFVQKVQVIGGRGQGVHVAGHAAQEEAKLILTITKPRSFVPSFGEERQLVLYGNFAEMIGSNRNDIHIMKNGDILELREQVARVSGKIPAQAVYYNQTKGLDIDELTMKERISLSKEGTITIAIALDEKRNIVAGPEIIAEACAFAKGKDWRAFCLGTIELVKEAINKLEEKETKDTLDLRTVIRDIINKTVLELIGKRPLINVSIQEIGKKFEKANIA